MRDRTLCKFEMIENDQKLTKFIFNDLSADSYNYIKPLSMNIKSLFRHAI